MPENVQITPGTGDTVAADQVTDGTLGTAKVQYVKLMDAAIGGTTKAGVSGDGLATKGKLWDGTNIAAVKAASTAPAASDPALVVALSPNAINANGATVAANSAPVVLATNQATLAVAQDTSQLAVGLSGTMATPIKVKISVAAATTTTLVAAVASKKIRVVAMYMISTGANTVNLQSHTTTSNSDGLPAYAANGGIVLNYNPIGWFDTVAGEALDMVTSAASQVSGQLAYVAV
jgi:hypothetical protein